MQTGMNGYMNGGYMNGYGMWTVLGVLLAIFLVVAIFKMLQKK